MNDNLKMGLNRMQAHLVSCTISDGVLYIFESEKEKNRYKQLLMIKHKNTPDKILKTLNDLCLPSGLTGLRFKRYWFITDEDFKELESQV